MVVIMTVVSAIAGVATWVTSGNLLAGLLAAAVAALFLQIFYVLMGR